VFLEANLAAHAPHRLVNEAVEPVSKQVESFLRVLDRERENPPSRDTLELLVPLGIGSESVADIVTDGPDDADLDLRPCNLACEQTAGHEPKPAIGLTHEPRVATLFIGVLDGHREKAQRRAACCLIRK